MKQPDEPLRNRFEKDGYEVVLNYLQYDDMADKLSFPMQLRERHLTQGPTDAWIQAVGPEVQISLWTLRDNVIIRLPSDSWSHSKVYKNQLGGTNNGLLSIGRVQDLLRPCATGEETKRIAGMLWVHEWEKP